ncbi:MAG: di-trans,poly-cis-decaprenylcistransferase [Mycoplasmataceae bacterium]|nr:di-trans,poly-cis-decaprenylcistransferase [Mycoplasmataceae bacterium]
MISNIPQHVAIIMDGNGRWANELKRPRSFGHKKGALVIDDILKTTIQKQIKVLSLFAFSIENWNRPAKEIDMIIRLAVNKLSKKTLTFFNEQQIQFRWTGFKERLPQQLVNRLLSAQTTTQQNSGMILNICLNYGGQQDILQAAQKINTSKQKFADLLLTKDLPPVDLLIRTGNEKRISNFMLWQSSYAEIIFEPTLWPAYNSQIFTKNLLEFSKRQRRFGRI